MLFAAVEKVTAVWGERIDFVLEKAKVRREGPL